ncbi:MAG: molybdopterin-synthase adenylyltransferase MoeB [Knoellia sp.]
MADTALSVDEARRYSRHLLLPDVGVDGQLRLKDARILVVGAGGLGSPALLYLAAAGVGTLGIVDDDAVEVSNLQRQVIHGMGDVGRPKVESATSAIAALNPFVTVRTHRLRLDSSNALDIIGDYDIVLDGSDNFPTRYLVSDACALAGKPHVWGAVSGFTGEVSVFSWRDGPTYRHFHPEPPPAGSVPSCAEGGVLGVVCSAVGSMMVTEALKLVLGLGRPLSGAVMRYDALAMTFDEVALAPDPDAVAVTELVDYADFCGVVSRPSEPAHEIDVDQCHAWLEDRAAGRRDFVLVDVREPGERAVHLIPGAVSVPLSVLRDGEGLADVDPSATVVLHCKAGGRSLEALSLLRNRGFEDVHHVRGGSNAWVERWDPTQPTY